MHTRDRANIVTDNWRDGDFADARISYRNIKTLIIPRDTRRLSFRIAFPAINVSFAEMQSMRTDPFTHPSPRLRNSSRSKTI